MLYNNAEVIMKCLVLSSSTGEGHNKAGLALVEELKKNHEVIFMDFLAFENEENAKKIYNNYASIIRTIPGTFGFFYKVGEIVNNKTIKSPVYFFNSKIVNKFTPLLEKEQFDFIIATHLFPAMGLTALRKKGLKVPIFYVATDYTAVPFSQEVETDLYFVPHQDLIDDFVKIGVKEETLRGLGIPISEKLLKAPSKKEARIFLGLDQYETIYTLMSGSLGGSLKKALNYLLPKIDKNDLIVVLCGNNEELFNSLKNKEQIYPVSFTDNMNYYIKASDVFFSKPGGLSSTEIAALNTPLIHILEIPGCETLNKNFFNERNLSLSGRTLEESIEMGIHLLKNEEKIKKMIASQKREINKNSSKKIIDAILKYVMEKKNE